MANINRYKYGDTKPVVARCNEGTGIEIGDLCYLEGVQGGTKDLRPASAIPDQGSASANRVYFACRFLGHASQQHRANQDPADDRDLRVNTAGVHKYACASQVWEIGDRVGVSENAAGTALLDQTVVQVFADDEAIGRVARREATAKTEVYVELFSEVMAGGADGGSCSGSSSGA